MSARYGAMLHRARRRWLRLLAAEALEALPAVDSRVALYTRISGMPGQDAETRGAQERNLSRALDDRRALLVAIEAVQPSVWKRAAAIRPPSIRRARASVSPHTGFIW